MLGANATHLPARASAHKKAVRDDRASFHHQQPGVIHLAGADYAIPIQPFTLPSLSHPPWEQGKNH
jgi:hypothetical protein